jgi:ectoine hydroxylase-related dioxygenase (phytanoyl-CoA dioxygenase family)
MARSVVRRTTASSAADQYFFVEPDGVVGASSIMGHLRRYQSQNRDGALADLPRLGSHEVGEYRSLVPDIAAELADRGFFIAENVVDAAALAEYRAALDRIALRAGQRDVLTSIPETRSLVERANLARLLAPVVGASARIVRAILFDKSQGANWRVPWHQDLFVATSARDDVPGFTAWTLKDGVNHARAPRDVLERMLAVRIHIDDNGETNGPLRVMPGTHRRGILDGAAIDRFAEEVAPVACVAPAGSVLVMRPLLLHASSPATSPAHRRIVHLEIADGDLPMPLRWHTAVPL